MDLKNKTAHIRATLIIIAIQLIILGLIYAPQWMFGLLLGIVAFVFLAFLYIVIYAVVHPDNDQDEDNDSGGMVL